MQAYQHEEPGVGVWELRHLVDLLSEHLKLGIEGPRSLQLQLFMAHGRLARLHQKMGKLEEAQADTQQAIAYYLQYSPTNHVVTNLASLLGLIQQFDQRAKLEAKYE